MWGCRSGRRGSRGHGNGFGVGGGKGAEDVRLALFGRVATEGQGVDAFGLEVFGHLGGLFALVDEDQDAFEVDAVGGEAVGAAG